MTRIVAGTARGRPLAVPSSGTRPTSDRAREALFSSLSSIFGGSLEGLRVLDLYAGSGAVGLEALSRGAASVVLVDHDPGAVRVLRANARTVGLPGVEVVEANARTYAERRAASAPGADPATGFAPGAAAPFDLVFLDPPYAVGDHDVRRAVLGLDRAGLLADDAVVAVERATRGGDFSWPDGYEALRSRRYGEATLWYGSRAPAPDDTST